MSLPQSIFPDREAKKDALKRMEVTEEVKKQNQLEFISVFAEETDISFDPELLKSREKLERQLPGIVARARRIDQMLSIPGHAELKQRQLEEYMGELTRTGHVEKEGNKPKALRYGRIIMGRLERMHRGNRIEKLEDAFDSARAEDPHYKIMSQIVGYIHAGKLAMPTDPDNFETEVDKHRYLIYDKALGIVRVKGENVRADLEKFKNIHDEENPEKYVLSDSAKVFRKYLEDLSKVDPEEHYENFVLPKLVDKYTPQSVKEAKGALKALLMLGLLTGGVVSLIMERDSDFPTVASIYLGLATLVYNPNILTDGPLERMSKTLGFTVDSGSNNEWRRLMNGKYKEHITGDAGVAFFDDLLLSGVQKANSDFVKVEVDRSITDEHTKKYFEKLEEAGASGNPDGKGDGKMVGTIGVLEEMKKRDPDLFKFLLENTSKVKASADQIQLKHLAENRMTSERIPRRIARARPDTNPTGLGRLGPLELSRQNSPKGLA